MSEQLIGDCLAALADHEGCMPVLPMKDTIYQSSDGTKLTICWSAARCLPVRRRKLSGCIRTRRSTGKHRKRSCPSQGEQVKLPTAMEWMWPMIPGDERNFKITTRSDLERFCTIVEGETK